MNTIKEISSHLSDHLSLAKRAAFLALLSLTISGCIHRPNADIAVWLFNPPPPMFCDSDPLKFGFYRRLNSGQYELISVCSPEAAKFIGIHERDAVKILPEPTLKK